MAQIYGGNLLATGSKSCVVHPNIKCKNNKYKKRNKKYISKIVFGETSKEYSIREKEINDKIRRIPNYKKWALIYDELCKPPSLKESIKIDKGLKNCLKEDNFELHSGIESKKTELFDKNSIMLIGDYGGITIGDYFKKNFDDINTIKELEDKFLIFVEKMDNLFKGLCELNKYDISHLDIKQNNIVIQNGIFKFIDFGLSNEFKNVDHFLKRSENEFKTQRIYVWYPIEYIYFSADKKQLEYEKQKIDIVGIDEFRNHMSIYDNINIFFGRNTTNDVISIIDDYLKMDKDDFLNEEYEELIKNIDTYSFGMLIPFLFYNHGLLENVEDSKMLTEFFYLFRDMCEPYYKNRISLPDGYKKFKSLLDKYSKNNKTKTKGSKKKKTKKKSKKTTK